MMTVDPRTPGAPGDRMLLQPRRRRHTPRFSAAIFVLAALLLAGNRGYAEDEDPEERAKELYEAYLSERRDDSWPAYLARLQALRELGPIDSKRARKDLLRVAKTGKALDDKAVAAMGLARYGDVVAVKDLLRTLSSVRKGPLGEVVAEGLGLTRRGDVIAWLAEEALAWKEPRGLLAVLRAHVQHAMPESREALTALFKDAGSGQAAFERMHAAVLALGRIGGEKVRVALCEAAIVADWRVRLAAGEGLAQQDQDDVRVADALRGLLKDRIAVVRRVTAARLGSAGKEDLLPEIAALLDDSDRCVGKAAYDALKDITEKDFGFDSGAWVRWWKERRGEIKKLPGSHTVASYHGVKVHSNHVLFVLDRSGSMRWPRAEKVTSRMKVAQRELVRVLRQLPPKTVFNVIAFDNEVQPWRKGEVEATRNNVEKAVKWVMRQESVDDAGTNTYEVLRRAFRENAGFDTLFFLSDGLPEDGEAVSSEALLAAVRDWNRYRHVLIHTIALTLENLNRNRFKAPPGMARVKRFMAALARVTGGKHTHVTEAYGKRGSER